MGKALVVFAHGEGYCVAWQAQNAVDDYMTELGCSHDGFDLDLYAVNIERSLIPNEGVWLFDLALVDDGPGDWPGSREVAISLSKGRPATKEEWTAHRNGEWPWKPIEKEPKVAVTKDPEDAFWKTVEK